MNTPDESIKEGWSVEFTGRYNWRDLGGTFDSWWEAGVALIESESDDYWAEARALKIEDQSHHTEVVPDNMAIDVGIFRDPEPAENLIRGEQIIDLMRESDADDYRLDGCGCEDFLARVTKEQEGELESAVRGAVERWLTRHELYPTWKVIGKSWTVTAGQIRAKAKESMFK